jgi:hypothetical protein
MEKPCTVDTVDENSHTVDTVVSAMENACMRVSYSNNSHIILELDSRIDLGLDSHIDPGLDSGSGGYTGHDLTLGGEQDRISYIKTLDYTQEMMKKFLDGLRLSITGSSNMRSSTKASNSVDLRQCISRDLDELNQDQVINKMKFHLKIQSSINQRGSTDGFCRRVKYGHFRSGQYGYFGSVKYGHFGSDKDGFYMPDKWFRAWCGPAISSQIAEGVCQAISGRLVGVG